MCFVNVTYCSNVRGYYYSQYPILSSKNPVTPPPPHCPLDKSLIPELVFQAE